MTASAGTASRAPGTDRSATVLAAGAICWRRRGTGIEVLLAHSVKYDEWSWPKGKLDPGESLPECAVREVAEETGLAIRLGPPLPPSRYVLPDGRAKLVRYWAAEVGDEQRARAASPDEIDDVAWVPLPRVADRLSRPGDRAPLGALAGQARDAIPVSTALLVLRHAEAQPRQAWSGSESDRPLSPLGRRQADALVGLLRCWQPQLLLSSTWERCTATLAPYAQASGVPVATKAGLTESGFRRHPGKVGRHLDRLAASGDTGLVCTHRPVLGGVMAALRDRVAPGLAGELPGKDPWLDVGEVLVLHRRGPREPLVGLERHSPAG